MIILEIPRILKNMGSVGQAHLGFIILVNKKSNTEAIIHESIHIKQQRELLVIFWYFSYLLHFIWLWLKLKNAHKAYRNVVFEKEAYKYEKNSDYIDKRKCFAWLNLT